MCAGAGDEPGGWPTAPGHGLTCGRSLCDMGRDGRARTGRCPASAARRARSRVGRPSRPGCVCRARRAADGGRAGACLAASGVPVSAVARGLAVLMRAVTTTGSSPVRDDDFVSNVTHRVPLWVYHGAAGRPGRGRCPADARVGAGRGTPGYRSAVAVLGVRGPVHRAVCGRGPSA